MKLQRTTLFLLFLALGLGGFVYFHEIRGASQQQQATVKEQQVFSFQADDVQSLTVKNKEQTVIVQRSDKSDNPKWLMKSPTETAASDGAVSFLMDLLVNAKSDRTLLIPANQLQEYGLDQPQATIEVKLKNQQTNQLILGKPDFNRRFLYAQTSATPKPDGNIEVLLVPFDFENAVNREVSEWKQPVNDSVKKSVEPTPKPTPTNSK